MTADNTSKSLSQLPLLSEEMKRILRLRAWRDEIFREALIADPKGVIQQLFPHCFPDGKIADNLTIKVIEEDPSTHHIVLPVLADEEPILDIAEEQQVDLLANMGCQGMTMNPHESQELSSPEKSTSKKRFDLFRSQAKGKNELHISIPSLPDNIGVSEISHEVIANISKEVPGRPTWPCSDNCAPPPNTSSGCK